MSKHKVNTTKRGTLIMFVTPTNLNGFTEQTEGIPLTASISFVTGPGSPPGIGGGSVQLATGSNGDGAAELRQSQFDLFTLADLTVLCYITYVSAFGSGGQAPYILLDINYGLGSTIDEQLFFEPVYQDGTYSGIPDQGALTLDTWQTWNAMIGGWHTGGGPPLTTLADYLLLHPNARIINSMTGGGLRIVAGLGAPDWDNFTGNVDQMAIGDASTTIIYEFGLTEDVGGCREQI